MLLNHDSIQVVGSYVILHLNDAEIVHLAWEGNSKFKLLFHFWYFVQGWAFTSYRDKF